MPLPELAQHFHARQRAIGARTEQAVASIWGSVDPKNVLASWSRLLPAAVAVTASGMGGAAAGAQDYVAAALHAQDVESDPDGTLIASSLGQSSSDGRSLASMYYVPALRARDAIATGTPSVVALRQAADTVSMMALTQVFDAGRNGTSIAMRVDRSVTGYYRVISSTACSRCAVLAGRWYATAQSAFFLRHPRCDCTAVPAARRDDRTLLTSPRAHFDGLSPAAQDRIYTRAGAQAIRDGADISRVVNARRGAAGLSPAGARLTKAELEAARGGRAVGRLTPTRFAGRDLYTTTEATSRRAGVASVRRGGPRLMPESILQIAGADRDLAVRLLRFNGYIL